MKELKIIKKENFSKLLFVTIVIFAVLILGAFFLRGRETSVSQKTFDKIYDNMQIQNIESYNANIRFSTTNELEVTTISNYNDEQVFIRSYNNFPEEYEGSGVIYEDGLYFVERVNDDEFEPGLYSEIDYEFKFLNALVFLEGLKDLENFEEVTIEGEESFYNVKYNSDNVEYIFDYFGYNDELINGDITGAVHMVDDKIDTITYSGEGFSIRVSFYSIGEVSKIDIN